MDLWLILSTATNAVFPVVLVILLGYWLRRIGFFSEEFVKMGNKLVFNILLPITLFVNVYNLDSLRSISWGTVLYFTAMIFVLFGLGILVAAVTTPINARRGDILQASFRSNVAIVGLPLATALGGDAAVSVVSMLMAFTVPQFNILAVMSYVVFTDEKGSGLEKLKGAVKKVIHNPLIRAICAGVIVLLLRELQTVLWGRTVFSIERDLSFLFLALEDLKAITTPLALLALGGQFEFSAVKSYRKEIIVGTLLRTVVGPVIGIGTAVLLSKYSGFITFGPEVYPAMIGLFGTPVAVSSAIMASQMGGDEQLATQLVVWNSIVSIFSIFTFSCVLMAAGLIQV